MPQSTVDLVQNLLVLYNKFLAFDRIVQDDLDKAETSYTCSLSYDTLKFTIHTGRTLYFQCKANYNDKTVLPSDFYHANLKDITVLLKQFVKSVLDDTEVQRKLSYPQEIDSYLSIAERIAQQAHYCAAGDNYHPGYFSEISLQQVGITLQQINHMNSRSLAHKKDYSLRNLEFFIPFQSDGQKISFQDQFIGVMRIRFSDRSSENNKKYGDRIRVKIEEEKQAFKKA